MRLPNPAYKNTDCQLLGAALKRSTLLIVYEGLRQDSLQKLLDPVWGSRQAASLPVRLVWRVDFLDLEKDLGCGGFSTWTKVLLTEKIASLHPGWVKMFTQSNVSIDAPNTFARQGPLTMGLLWVSMITIFPCVLIGFEWCRDGLTLWQVIACTALSCLILLVYTVPVAQLAALSGQGYGSLNRLVFGAAGAALINFNLVWIFIGFYGLAALLLADGLTSLFHLQCSVPLLVGGLAVAMAFNNLFGFAGVANFARFLAAPVLIVWVCYTFAKVAPTCPTAALLAHPQHSFMYALATVSSFVIGVAVWGNEADYWRHGKAKVAYTAWPLLAALVIAQLIFPVTGFMVAHMTGISDFGAATKFMNGFSFGNIPLLGALVLGACYFASADSNLFGSCGALQNLLPLPRRVAVSVLGLLGAAMAVLLSVCGAAKALDCIAAVNCAILPTPTVIVLAEWWLATKAFGFNWAVLTKSESRQLLLPQRASWIALAVGWTTGLATAGVIPGCSMLHVGVCPLNAWLAALAVYIPLRLYEYQSALRRQQVLIAHEEHSLELPAAVS